MSVLQRDILMDKVIQRRATAPKSFNEPLDQLYNLFSFHLNRHKWGSRLCVTLYFSIHMWILLKR